MGPKWWRVPVDRKVTGMNTPDEKVERVQGYVLVAAEASHQAVTLAGLSGYVANGQIEAGDDTTDRAGALEVLEPKVDPNDPWTWGNGAPPGAQG